MSGASSRMPAAASSDPEEVEAAARAGDRDRQRPDELERHRDPQRQPVEGLVEAEVHPRERQSRTGRCRGRSPCDRSERPVARRRRGRSPRTAVRRKTVPPGPMSSNSVVARAEPNWTEVMPVRTSPTGDAAIAGLGVRAVLTASANVLRAAVAPGSGGLGRWVSHSSVVGPAAGAARAHADHRGGRRLPEPSACGIRRVGYRGPGTTAPIPRPTRERGEPLFKRLSAIVVGLIAMLALPAVASAKDYADTALNIIPSGQLQPGQPPGAEAQRRAGDHVRRPDAALRPGHRRRPDHLLQVRGAQQPRHRRARHARDDPRPSRRSRSPATSTASPTSSADTTRTASSPPAGSPPRTAACCSSRPATTRASPRSTRPGLSAIGLVTQLQELRAQRADRGRRRQADPGPEGRRARRARRSSPTSTPTSTGSTHCYELRRARRPRRSPATTSTR